AHMDLVSVHPVFNLYNRQWPILTSPPQLPPAKFVLGGRANESMVGMGSIITNAEVHHSVISPDVQVAEGATVSDSVVMQGVRIGPGAIVRRAILDKNVVIPAGVQLGVDLDRDRKLYTVTDSGIVVLGKGEQVVP
ncbi:MAG TPA: glucose-1-phosphate adenylyltransferase, partial [Mycobacteriales bacterium]